MPQIMVKRNWPSATFRRTIGDEQLVFEKDSPTDVTDEQLQALAPDIGRALLLCYLDDSGRFRLVSSLDELPDPVSKESELIVEGGGDSADENESNGGQTDKPKRAPAKKKPAPKKK